MFHLVITFLFAANLSSAEPNSFVDHYISFYQSTFQRLLELEEKIDGLDHSSRLKIRDRKKSYPTQYPGKSILLEDPVLLHAVISERKRLEKQQTFIEEVSKSPRLSSQFEKQLAADFLSLEVNNIIFLYIEHLSDFLSGKKTVNSKTDLETKKILAATLTALYFSKENKKKMALFDQEVLKHTQKTLNSTLRQIYEVIGPFDKDLLPLETGNFSVKKEKQIEQERLEKTKKLLALIERLSQILLKSNRAYWDEYQYNVLKASKSN
jgi:hypothetical protein